MKHPERVEDYLGHIAEAIERATSYVQPLPDIDAFRQNPLVQDGVVRNIEIIGEAANHINRMAPEFIAQHPELPWPNMRNMRNIVIHAYFNVDLTTVWRTVQRICRSWNSRSLICSISSAAARHSNRSQTAPDECPRPRERRGRRPTRTPRS
jgi:uncharacterized protein with HEPN domain